MSSAAASATGGLFWTHWRLRALRHGLWVGAVMSALIAVTVVTGSRFGVDAHAYWAAWRHHALYAIGPRRLDAYPYSPAFAQAIWPATLLPWPAFCTGWTMAVAGAYAWLLSPLESRWRVPLLILCTPDIVAGNVWAFFALVLVFGFRHPGLWAFPLLTKVTPIVGPVWFLARREWRPLAEAIVTTVLVALVSFAVAPSLWGDWASFLLHPRSTGAVANAPFVRPLFHPPTAVFLAVTMPTAIAITVFAARRDRPWLLPVAMVIATPFFTANAFAVLTAIPRIRQRTADAGRQPIAASLEPPLLSPAGRTT